MCYITIEMYISVEENGDVVNEDVVNEDLVNEHGFNISPLKILQNSSNPASNFLALKFIHYQYELPLNILPLFLSPTFSRQSGPLHLEVAF